MILHMFLMGSRDKWAYKIALQLVITVRCPLHDKKRNFETFPLSFTWEIPILNQNPGLFGVGQS